MWSLIELGVTKCFLSFNEPDKPEQFNMVAEWVIELWPHLKELGMSLVSHGAQHLPVCGWRLLCHHVLDIIPWQSSYILAYQFFIDIISCRGGLRFCAQWQHRGSWWLCQTLGYNKTSYACPLSSMILLWKAFMQFCSSLSPGLIYCLAFAKSRWCIHYFLLSLV